MSDVKKLLIVEDDDRVRASLRLALEDEGYDVGESPDAEHALTDLRHHGAPDVLIVDLMLGGMDGFTCIREVRKHHDMPIIVVSARDDTHDVVAALEAAVTAVVVAVEATTTVITAAEAALTAVVVTAETTTAIITALEAATALVAAAV